MYKRQDDETLFHDGEIMTQYKAVTVTSKALDVQAGLYELCLLYTSDAADDLLCVDLGGRRIIYKKNTSALRSRQPLYRCIVRSIRARH